MEQQNNQDIQNAPVEQSLTQPETKTKNNWLSFFSKNFLALSILIAGVMISGSVLYSSQAGIKNSTAQIGPDTQAQAPNNVKADVSADDDPSIGSKNAKVVLIEFSDFQCPFCRSFWKDTLPQIKKEYIDTGKIRFVYRDFPLSFHPGAGPAAEGGNCAREQGKFWELHDKIFQEQDKQGQGTIQFGKPDVVKWAGQIGLDMSKFNQCLDSGRYKAEIEKDIADGTAAGVSGTPTTFINGRSLVGAQPYASFKAIIDEELKK